MAQAVQADVLGHGQGAQAGGIGAAKVAIHILQPQAGVGQRAQGHLGMELGCGEVVGTPRGVLVNAGDIGLA